MKKFLILSVLVVFVALSINAQTNSGVAINETGAAADPSAMLDVSSSNKGFLVSRMSETERMAINNPARGLLVYQIDNTTGFWFFDGSSWVQANAGDNLGNHIATDSLDMANKKITNLATCTNNLDAANKAYVDNAVAAGGGSSFTMMSTESLTTMNFGDAIRYCKNLTETVNAVTYSDWRLPSFQDMIYVVSTGGNYVPNNTSSNYFWVSMIVEPSITGGYVRYIIFRLNDGGYYFTDHTSVRNVRCIR